MKNNERNAGRKKKTNEPYTVRCHPKAIYAVREFAILESEKYTAIVNHVNQKNE